MNLFRNLDVVCVDSGEGPHRLRLAPAGRLREPLAGLRRASCLVWTRSDKDRPSARLTSRVLKGMKPELPVFRAFNRITGFTGLGEAAGTLEPDRFQGEPVALLAAIACPERLRADLESLGVRVVWVATRRDHHAWRPKEIQRLLAAAKKSGAGAVLTTGKDAVKLDFLKSAPLPIYQVNIITQVVEAEDFEALLDSVPAP
ncbi:MAG: tetraacyldisaccharide 4'-kinase [Acidobacteriota bacterium]